MTTSERAHLRVGHRRKESFRLSRYHPGIPGGKETDIFELDGRSVALRDVYSIRAVQREAW